MAVGGSDGSADNGKIQKIFNHKPRRSSCNEGLLSRGSSLVVALVAASCVGITQFPGIAFAQAPEKGNPPAARPAPRAAPSTGLPAPAPRAVARPPTVRAPAQRPVTVQPRRPQRPAVVQRPPQQRAVKQSNAPKRVQQQAQEPRQQLKQAQGSAGSAARRSQTG